MDAPAATAPLRFNRLLPYWAVLQTDLRQTLQSWVYRLWVLLMVVFAGVNVAFQLGMANAWKHQPASLQTGDLIRGLVVGSLALLALLSVSSISSERGTVADSVLSRGISRYQYYLAKWHSRLAVTLGTFAVVAGLVLVSHALLFNQKTTGADTNLDLRGGLTAVLAVAAGLAVIVSWGVAIGALSNGTVIGITLFWIALYGGMLVLSQLPDSYPTPERLLGGLKNILRGQYDDALVTRFVGVSAVLAVVGAVVGMVGFSRRDV